LASTGKVLKRQERAMMRALGVRQFLRMHAVAS
jgi:hypothetical protein